MYRKFTKKSAKVYLLTILLLTPWIFITGSAEGERPLAAVARLIAPTIEVTPSSFSFTLDEGDSTTATMVIKNTGDETLTFDISDLPDTSSTLNQNIPQQFVTVRRSLSFSNDVYPSKNFETFSILVRHPINNEPMTRIKLERYNQVLSSIEEGIVIFRDDMENGINGWDHYATDSEGIDQWVQTSLRAKSGTISWNVSQHSGVGSDALQSPSIDLRAIDGATLAFEHFYNFDDCSDPTFDPDGGIVEISTDGGTSWTQLFPEDGYPYVLDDNCSNPLAFYEAYSHDSDIFVPALFDLTLYVGNIINIRFHAGWDCGNCDSNEGWFIDDVTVFAGDVAWLSETPDSGTVQPGESVIIAVKVFTDLLDVGHFNANILISSNDPDEGQITLPVALKVIGSPEIHITITLLDFEKAFIGFPSSEFIKITNQGSDTLKITDILFDNPEYSTESTSIDILAGTDYDLKIDFMPTAAGFRFGVVNIRSNDADEDSISIALIGEAVPPPDIELSADSLFADLFTGGVDSQRVTISNIGLSDLTYEIFIVRDTTKESLASAQPINNADLRIKLMESELGFGRNSLSSNTRPEIGFYADESRVRTGILRQALAPAISTALSDSDSALILNKFDNFVAFNTGIAWANDTLYSISFTDSMLVSYDLGTESVTVEFPIKTSSFGLAWDGTYLWIGNGNGNIYGYDLDGTEIGSFSAPFAAFPTLAWDGEYFIMSNLFDFMPTFYKVDVTGAVVDSFTSSFSVAPTQIAWVEEHNSLWLYDSEQTRLFQVELVDGTTNLLNEYVLFDSVSLDFAYSLTHDGTDLWWSDLNSQLHQVDDGIDEVGSWITLIPSSGTIAAGASADIDVIFDAEGLFGGNYYVVLDFESNDPATPVLNVSVRLKVTGAPDAVLSVDTLNFGIVFTMPYEDTLSVTLINRGTDTLKVSEITADAAQINASPTSPFVLLPTEKEIINIVIQSADPVSVSGTVTIHSNDPDDPLLLLHIIAEVVTPPVISVSPDSLDDHLFSGDSSIHFLTIQNTGGSDLTFGITSMIVDIIAPVSSKANKFAEEADVGALRRLNIMESKVFTGRVKTEVVEKSRDSRGNVRAKLRPSVKSWHTRESSGTLFSTISSGKILGKIDKAAGKSYGPIENIDMSNWSQSSSPAAGEYQRSDFTERKKESLWERGTIGFDAPKVLLLAAEFPEFEDLAETALISTGLFVDSDIDALISPSLITLNDLTPFDAVLMWTDFNFADPQNIGDVLKQYVDSGGGVILATYAYSTNWAIQGAILDADYSPFIPGTEQSVSGRLDLSSLQFPGHPIFANININPEYWSNSNYSNPSLNTGGILLAQDTFGNNVVAENSTGKVVGITVFPTILDVNNFDTNDETRLMFANALYYVSNPEVSWLTANPQSATLPADSSLTIEVLFDANGLFGGDYYAELVFESNDPDPSRRDISIPVHLGVTGVPDIFSDENTIDFGQVFVGYNAGGSLTIRNIGTDTLFIDNITTNLSQLTLGTIGQYLLPRASESISLTLLADNIGSISGLISVSSNDPDMPQLDISVLAEAVFAPVAAVSPLLIVDTLMIDQSSVISLTIANTGGSDLYFIISESTNELASFSSSNSVLESTPAVSLIFKNRSQSLIAERNGLGPSSRTTLTQTARLNTKGFEFGTVLTELNSQTNTSYEGNHNSLSKISSTGTFGSGQGGPDNFGHTWIDSDEPGGPVFDWVDISSLGTSVSLSDDSNTGLLDLGFDFSFYDNLFSQVAVSSNGWLSFTNTAGSIWTDSLPSMFAPENVIALYAYDLFPASGSSAWYYSDTANNRFIFQFSNWGVCCDTTPYFDMQAILYADGRIILQYLSVTGIDDVGTVGIQNADRDDGLTVSTWGNLYIHDNLAVLIHRGITWLEVNPAEGTVPQGQDLNVDISLNAAGLTQGDYVAYLSISTNDPETPQITVPVQLIVDGIIGVDTEDFLPKEFALEQNYPNPFNPMTRINYALPKASSVSLIIYNMMGQEVIRWNEQNADAGYYSKVWNGKNKQGMLVSSGIYIYRLVAGDFTKTKKMVLLK
ncbi:T9SS type A sorting domain-containing protein [Candidatus Marinimicrobia bacterium MT.SAG.4]|nr:T9SS type A sorting domain-containing protein [Candidatus Marinimicrobia bacterium MT.SAG.4]